MRAPSALRVACRRVTFSWRCSLGSRGWGAPLPTSGTALATSPSQLYACNRAQSQGMLAAGMYMLTTRALNCEHRQPRAPRGAGTALACHTARRGEDPPVPLLAARSLNATDGARVRLSLRQEPVRHDKRKRDREHTRNRDARGGRAHTTIPSWLSPPVRRAVSLKQHKTKKVRRLEREQLQFCDRTPSSRARSQHGTLLSKVVRVPGELSFRAKEELRTLMEARASPAAARDGGLCGAHS